jgi:hypothetical protein
MTTNTNENENLDAIQTLYRLSKGKALESSYFFKSFLVTSGYIHITDPCYEHDLLNKGYREDIDGWIGRFDIPAEVGDWMGRVTAKTITRDGIYDTRNLELVAFHMVRGPNALFHDRSTRHEFFNGVDSGQMGIFDSSIFPRTETRNYESGFYHECCRQTLSEDSFGIVRDQGIVTSSGWGDGNYRAILTFGPTNRVIGVRIFFDLKIEGLDT